MADIKALINVAGFSLKAGRVTMKPVTQADAEAYCKAFDEDDVTRYMCPDPFRSTEDAAALLGSFEEQRRAGCTLMCVIMDDIDGMIGDVEAYDLDTNAPEIGVWIAKDHWHQGIAFDALSAFIAFLKWNGAYDHFVYTADARNVASIRLVDKLGGVRVGHEDLTTQSGKLLKLDIFHIKA